MFLFQQPSCESKIVTQISNYTYRILIVFLVVVGDNNLVNFIVGPAHIAKLYLVVVFVVLTLSVPIINGYIFS